MTKSEKFINRLLLGIWNEFIYGGHLIGISSGLIALISFIILGKYQFLILILLVCYFLALVIYNANHLKEVEEDCITNPERAYYLKKRYSLSKILLFFYIFLLFSLSFLVNMNVVLYSLFIILIGILYPKSLTKKIVAFKDLYVSFFWSTVVFLPYLTHSLTINLSAILLFIFIFLRSLINIIYYDIKDIQSDKEQGIKTLPVLFGTNQTINFLHFFNIISCVPLLIAIYYKILPFYTLSLSLVCLYTGFYLIKGGKSDNEKLRNISYTLVDGEAIFWVVILLLGKSIF